MTAVDVEIEDSDGRRKKLILRQYGQKHLRNQPNAAENEFKLLQLTHSLGLATPRAYYFDQSGQIFSRPFLVLEYIEGQLEFAPAKLSAYLNQLASQLAKIHNVDNDELDLSFLPHHENGCPESDVSHSVEADDTFHETSIRDALFAAWPLPPGNANALLHGDYWPGNILWQGERLTAVIDWEDAELGDPLLDLARIRSEIVWIFGVEAMEAFTDHYLSLKAIDYSNLPYWDLCAALRFIRLFGSDLSDAAAFFTPFGRTDITEKTILENCRYFISRAFERLESPLAK